MTIIILIFFLIVLPSIKLLPQDNVDFLDRTYTDSIKGIFLFFVFVRHFLQYNPIFSEFNSLGLMLDSRLGQLIVTMFLFYSGYGVMESLKRKRETYIDAMPRKRIWTTLYNFDIAVIIFALLALIIDSCDFSVKKLILSLVAWDSLGNSNWYIFCILMMYVLTYVSFKVFKKQRTAVLSVFVCSILYVVILSRLKPLWWWDTGLCYAVGMLFSYKKDMLVFLFQKKYWLCLLTSFIILFMLKIMLPMNGFIYVVYSAVFAICVVLISMRISVNSPVLIFIGGGICSHFIFTSVYQ